MQIHTNRLAFVCVHVLCVRETEVESSFVCEGKREREAVCVPPFWEPFYGSFCCGESEELLNADTHTQRPSENAVAGSGKQ